jgi:hypothetical protein
VTLGKVQEDIRHLYSMLSAREGKYVRNMNRYMNNGVRRESLWTVNTAPQAYVTPAQGVDGTQTQLNLIKSCIDSVASRISQANVRPFFNPVNGNYDTNAACETAQHFFDIWLDEQHAYPKSVACFRDAATYDIGVMYVNPLSKGLQRLAPWEYFLDPAEYYHGAVTRAMVLKKFYPLAGVALWSDSKEIKALFESDPHAQGEYATYYDLYKGEVWQFYDHIQLAAPEKLDFTQYGGLYRRPFVEMFYTKPMRGFYSVGLADDLYPIQKQVDELVRRLDNASRKAVLNMIMVPNGSGLKASNLENGVTAYQYNPGPDGGKPDVITPPAINPQYLQLLEMYMDKAYQMAGISQLSAQSQKPSGLNSGKALQTMEDIESDRFNTQLQQFTHFLVDVARVSIDVFPGKDPILPRDIGRGKLTWGDIRKQRDLFSVQFSAASSLSKDPEEKRNEIQFLIDSGMIDKGSIARFYQMPDLEGVYTLASSAENYVERIIQNAIKDGQIDYAETIDLQLLKSKALAKLNQLNAADDDPLYIDRLTDLLYKVLADIKNVGALVAPEEQKAPPPPPSTMALDAGQMTALSGLATAVAQGLPPASARAIAALSFPAADPKVLDAVIQGALPPPPPVPAPVQGLMAPRPMAGIPSMNGGVQ